jgi:hypothetical protein
MALLCRLVFLCRLFLTGAAYGRLVVGMLIGSQSTLDHGLLLFLALQLFLVDQ